MSRKMKITVESSHKVGEVYQPYTMTIEGVLETDNPLDEYQVIKAAMDEMNNHIVVKLLNQGIHAPHKFKVEKK